MCAPSTEEVMMNSWEGKVVLITGGSSGIGKATAVKFLKKGAKVYITGRNLERLEIAQLELQKISDKIEIIPMNVAIPAECGQAIDYIINKEQRLDVLVNSAGVSYSGPSVEMTEKVWDETIDVNLKGTFFMPVVVGPRGMCYTERVTCSHSFQRGE